MRLSSLLLVMGALAACSDFVPGKDARIHCGTDADCPDAWHCNAQAQLCIPDGSDDKTAPAVADAAVAPAGPLAVGARVHIQFTASEPLATDPVVVARAGDAGGVDREATLLEDETDRRARHWAFAYVVVGDELGAAPASGPVSFDATLTDDAGNAATSALGDIALDFEPPTLAPVAIVPPAGQLALKPSDIVAFETDTEAGARSPTARLVVNDTAVDPAVTPRLSDSAGPPPGTHIAGSIALGTFGIQDGDSLAVEVAIADALGNVAAPVRSAAVLVDATAPSGSLVLAATDGVVLAPAVRALVTTADATSVCFRGDVEPASACSTPAEFIPVDVAGYDLLLTAAEGLKTVEAVLADDAFNTSSSSATVALLASGVLTSAPALVLPNGQTAVKNGDTLTITGSTEPGAFVRSAALIDVDNNFAVVQAIPASDVGVDANGALSGAFGVPQVPDGDLLVLEVDVGLGALTSAPANSRSQPVLADNTPPQGAALSVEGNPTEVASAAIRLVISATGATEMRIDGDVQDAGNVRAFVPFTSPVGVLLSAGDGLKQMSVELRDGAHNTVTRATSVTRNGNNPGVAAQLVSPHDPVLGVKANDVAHLQGIATTDATVDVATLRFLDQAGAPLVGAGCAVDVTSAVSLVSQTLSGNIPIGTPCPGALNVDLQVIVRSAAGLTSDPTTSTTAALYVDTVVPSATASLTADASLHGFAGFTRTRTVSLNIAVTDNRPEPSARQVTGDVVGVPAGFQPLAANGTELIDLRDLDGTRTVTVQIADAVGNLSAPVVATIVLDRAPPAAPPATLVQLAEINPDPDNPALIAAVNDEVFVAGAANALGAGAARAARAFAYRDVALTQRITFPFGVGSTLDLPVNAQNGFDAQQIANDGSRQVVLVAVDEAGNESIATQVRVPALTIAGVDSPHGSAPLTFTVTSSLPLAAAPLARAGGRTGAGSTCSGSGTTFTCAFLPNGTELAGLNRAVLRVFGDAQGFAPGTTGTGAQTLTFDFTPPVIDAAKLVVVENDPGTADQVSGLAAAIADRAGPDDVTSVTQLRATVFTGAGGTGTAFGANTLVGTNGSLGTINIGDNADDVLFVRVTDDAGNIAEASFTNDIAAPVVSALAVAPTLGRSGAPLTITFSVIDNAHPLQANPAVTVQGRAATFVAGSLATGGVAQAFTFTFTPAAGTETQGTQAVLVRASDTAGNTGSASTNVTFDFTLPLATNILPGVRATWNGLPGISGTASDVGSSLVRVDVSLEDTTTARFFDGAAFSSVAPVLVAATGTAAWSVAVAQSAYVDNHGYVLTFRAVDAAGNLSIGGGPLTWTHDATPPQTTITSANPGTTAATSVSVTFASNEGGSTFECSRDGAGFTACTSPAAFAGLVVGDHTFAVRATDGAGNVDPTPASETFHVGGVFVQTAKAPRTALAVAQDHSLWFWGDAATSLAIPGGAATAVPTQVGADRDWAEVAAGGAHQCGVRLDGTLWCWGKNAHHQLGVTGGDRAAPVQVDPDTDWEHVVLRGDDSCALRLDQSLWCWGENRSGELSSDGSTAALLVPTQVVVAGNPRFTAVSMSDDRATSGANATCAVGDGALFCWGDNTEQRLGLAGASRPGAPTQVGTDVDWLDVTVGATAACGIEQPGKLMCWGRSDAGATAGAPAAVPTVVGTDVDWQSVALTDANDDGVTQHACGIRGSGVSRTLLCWGTGLRGELGLGTATAAPTVVPTQVGVDADWQSVSVAEGGTVGVRAGGIPFCFGGNERGGCGTGVIAEKTAPGAGVVVRALAGASRATCRALANGDVECSGSARLGRLGDGGAANRATYALTAVTGADIVELGAGHDHVCALGAGGVLSCWGGGTDGLLANGALTDAPTPVEVPGERFLAFATSNTNTCAVTISGTPGTLECSGLLEDGTTIAAAMTPIETATNWTDVAAGDGTVCAIDDTGAAFCFGDNAAGQVGNGAASVRETTLQPVAGGHVWTHIAVATFAGGHPHACGIDDAQRLFCWGEDGHGELGDGALASPFTATPQVVAGTWLDVTASGSMTCGVQTDHRLFCWGVARHGDVDLGVVTVPQPITGETTIASARLALPDDQLSLCVTRLDGTGACFGDGAFGALGDGDGFAATAAPVVLP